MRPVLLFIVSTLLMTVINGQSNWQTSEEVHGFGKGNIQNSHNDITKEFESRLLSRRPPLFMRPPRQLERKLDSVVLSGVQQSSGEVIKRYKGSFEYNASHLLSSEKISLWYKGPGRWLDLFRSEHEYDAIGRLKGSTTYEIDEYAREFKLLYRTEYTWDDQDLIESMEYEWDAANNEWIPRWRTQKRYDPQWGEEALSSEFTWDRDSETWISFSKYESVYDAFGNLFRYMAYRWDADFNLWRLNWLYEYVYDRDDRIVSQSNIEVKDGQWNTGSKYEFIYDGYGDVAEELFLAWNDQSEMMGPVWKDEFEYDSDRAIVGITTMTWNRELERWEDERKLVYESDKSFKYDHLLLPPTIFEDDAEQKATFRFMVRNMFVLGWDESEDSWVEAGTSSFYYSGLSTSIKDLGVSRLNIYPNPSDGCFTIALTDVHSNELELEIIDLNGRQVAKGRLMESGVVDLRWLNSGIYILRVKDKMVIRQVHLIVQ